MTAAGSVRTHVVVPLVVAVPMFLQSLDTFAIATALPAMATALRTPVLQLNLAITAYLLSVALSLPASAWLADRYGPRNVFCLSVMAFVAGSALCGMASSLAELTAYRVLQGIGGGLMVPVGRTLLMRSVAPAERVKAMVWFSVPGAAGRLAGPFLGGLIVSLVSWQWIFYINVPIGILGVLLAYLHVQKDAPVRLEDRRPFDWAGMLILTGGFGGFMLGVELLGKPVLPAWAACLACAVGAFLMYIYVRRSRSNEHALLDLSVLRSRSFRVTVVDSFAIRVVIGVAPFLLPIMLQTVLKMSALTAGLLTMGLAVGSLSTRLIIVRAINRYGFRRLLTMSAWALAAINTAYCFLSPGTSHALMFSLFVFAGLVSAIVMVSLNTVGFFELETGQMGHATALSTMVQQMSVAVGVVLGAQLVEQTHRLSGLPPGVFSLNDFRPAFAVLAALSVASSLSFRRLEQPDQGAQTR
jgi:EmrB/QacA subfamily drug resistance transporter